MRQADYETSFQHIQTAIIKFHSLILKKNNAK